MSYISVRFVMEEFSRSMFLNLHLSCLHRILLIILFLQNRFFYGLVILEDLNMSKQGLNHTYLHTVKQVITSPQSDKAKISLNIYQLIPSKIYLFSQHHHHIHQFFYLSMILKIDRRYSHQHHVIIFHRNLFTLHDELLFGIHLVFILSFVTTFILGLSMECLRMVLNLELLWQMEPMGPGFRLFFGQLLCLNEIVEEIIVLFQSGLRQQLFSNLEFVHWYKNYQLQDMRVLEATMKSTQ